MLRAACITLLSAQVPALVATLPLGLHAPAATAQTQSAEAVAKVAQAITVRIEGATQGSGVLVKREGNRYTVLTAWHVVSGQRPGEELDLYTPDGRRHSTEQGSIKQLGNTDMAEIAFTSTMTYALASIGNIHSANSGASIYISGFPLPSSAIPARVMRFKIGQVEANIQEFIPNGYQLLYSNPTLPGMSGGAVLNNQGQLIAIHGQGETDSKMTEQQGVAVKTGTNQAVPITYYIKHSSNAAVVTDSRSTMTDEQAKSRAVIIPTQMSQSLMERYKQAVQEQEKLFNSLMGR